MTSYLYPGFDQLLASNQDRDFAVPRGGTLRHLFIHNRETGSGPGGFVYSIRVNGNPTALAVTLPVATLDGSHIIDDIVVSPGDLVGIEVEGDITSDATTVSPLNVTASVRFD